MSLPTLLPTMAGKALLATLLASAVLTGWTIQGWRKNAVIADLRLSAAQADTAAALTLAKATSAARQREQEANQQQQQRAAQLIKEKTDAQADRDRFITAVRTGALRLSIPIRARDSDTCSADTTAVTGNRHQARAELNPEAAQFLDAIARDGDNAIRQLNACIDSYNNVRDHYHVQAGQP